MPLTRIRLLGKLGQRFVREIELDIHSAAEAIRAIATNFPDFLSYLHESHEQGVGYRLVVKTADLDEEELEHPIGFRTLVIVPAVYGSGGAFKIIAGVALIALAGPLGGAGILGLTASNYTLIDAALILSGVSQLLSPTPKDDKRKQSFAFNGPVNTTEQGRPVPICYGRLIVGSQVISAGISLDRIAGEI